VLVDSSGRVVEVITGYNNERLTKALSKAGFGD
jgi:hypothetical protein